MGTQMRPFGIALLTADKREFFSTTTMTWNWIGSFIAPANETVVKTYPALRLLQSYSHPRLIEVIFQRTFVNNFPDNQEAIIHTCSLGGGDTVTASGGNQDTMVVVLAR